MGVETKLIGLSDGQKAALALVAQYKSSKEIARMLGISPHTVDQRMKRVQAILGVNSRFEAARLYAAASATPADQPSATWGDLIYHASGYSDWPAFRRNRVVGCQREPGSRQCDDIASGTGRLCGRVCRMEKQSRLVLGSSGGRTSE